VVYHPQTLYRARLGAVVRLQALILTVHHMNGVNYESLTIPEAYGIAVPQRLRRVVRDMTAPISVDAASFALLLIDPPGLARCDNELTQKRLRKPAWIAC